MRITNKIMQNNSLSNINTNKVSQDKLNTMMSTQKKITKPSDDPVVAIRSLRLRSSVTTITQYYEKNVPDAKSWLEVTEDSLKNVTDVLTDMIQQVTKGASETLESKDREVVIEQLKELRKELYATGDADYAGRYIFTGYRTDTSLSFTEAKTQKYTITEQLDSSAIDEIMHVNTKIKDAAGEYIKDANGNYTGASITDVNDSNYNNTDYSDATEQNCVTATNLYRIRLAYSDCSDADGANGGVNDTPMIEYTDKDGNTCVYCANGVTPAGATVTGEVTVAHSYDIPDPYENIPANGVVFLADTGELLLSEEAYNTLVNTKDNVNTSNADESEIRITYSKSEWAKNDLRPEHYFACESENIKYNEKYLTYGHSRQSMEYDVGFNQVIEINTTADECYTHDIGREVDDLVAAMQQMVDIEKTVATIESTMKNLSESDPDYNAKKTTLQNQLDAANKAHTYIKEKVQTEFTTGITAMQEYLNQANLALTNCGTRGAKLDLIESRLMSQQTTFETLKSNNEDADITEVAIKLNSAEVTYEASLMATGKIMQTSLLNFI